METQLIYNSDVIGRAQIQLMLLYIICKAECTLLSSVSPGPLARRYPPSPEYVRKIPDNMYLWNL